MDLWWQSPINSWLTDGEIMETVTDLFWGSSITADSDCSHEIKTLAILKEISPEYSLEGLMQKLQYLGHLIQRTDSSEKTLMLGKIEGRRRRG